MEKLSVEMDVEKIRKESAIYRDLQPGWTYGGGGVHHSLLPQGPGSSLALTCIKSECPANARGGGGVRGFQMTGALDKQTKSFSRHGVKIWNSFPCEMHQMSKNNFKINVHNTLLQI